MIIKVNNKVLKVATNIMVVTSKVRFCHYDIKVTNKSGWLLS